MARFRSLDELFEGRHFDHKIILLCVRWYLRFKLSFRNLVEMMAERGLSMAHTSIMRWVHHYAPEFEREAVRTASRTFVARRRNLREGPRKGSGANLMRRHRFHVRRRIRSAGDICPLDIRSDNTPSRVLPLARRGRSYLGVAPASQVQIGGRNPPTVDSHDGHLLTRTQLRFDLGRGPP
jgi:hypothetical protein